MSMKLASVSGIALATALALTAATPSAEAGGSLKDTYVPAPVAMWAGCYLGGHAGGAWEDEGDIKRFDKKHYYDVSDTQAVSHSDDNYKKVDDFGHDEDDDTSFIGGGQIGCNWQDAEFVYGIEGDVSFGDNIDYLASIRGRLGVAFDDVLVFLTAGVAFIGHDDEFGLSYGPYKWSFGDDESETGFVIGGGFEKKLDPNWSFGVEGLYYVFDDSDESYEWYDGSDDKGQYKFAADRDKDGDVFVVRARLNYHFDRIEEPLPSLK